MLKFLYKREFVLHYIGGCGLGLVVVTVGDYIGNRVHWHIKSRPQTMSRPQV